MEQVKSNLKVLVLYTNYGAGHFSCAKQIKSVLEEENVEVFMENVHRIQNPISTKIIESGYNDFFTRHANNVFIKNLYGIMFSLANNISFIRYFLVQKTGGKIAYKIIEDKNIDIVILTYPHYLKTDVPCIVTLTDYKFSNAWKLKKNDIYLINNENDIKLLKKKNISEKNIYLSKIPLSSSFNISNNETKLSSVLINLGARGQGSYKNIEYNIQKLLEKNIQVGIMTGKNTFLHDKLKKKFSDVKEEKLKIYPFIKNVHEVLVKYNIVVTKAGGLSISECIQTERPIIINLSQTLKGQEYSNVEYVLHNDIGDTSKEKEIYKKIFEYVDDENKYENQVNKIKKIKSEINSQRKIIDIIKEISE